MVESLFDIVKYEYGNFTSKQGCVQWCKSQFLLTSIPRNVYLRYFQNFEDGRARTQFLGYSTESSDQVPTSNQSHGSIAELVKLSDTEVDGRVFKRMNSNRNLESEKSVKLKDLSKDLLFITDGYFDFNEMIWKDRSDGRAIKPSQWYQNDLFYLRQIFHFQFWLI